MLRTYSTSLKSPVVVRIAVLLSLSAAVCWAQPPGPAVTRIVGVEYPWFARVAVLQGTVKLAATVSREGSVTNVRVISGPKPLADAASDTFSKWQFAACPSGDCHVELTFSFVLNGSCNACSHCPTEFEVNLPDKVRITSKSFNGPLMVGHGEGDSINGNDPSGSH